jgi:hypothetical protein
MAVCTTAELSAISYQLSAFRYCTLNPTKVANLLDALTLIQFLID